MTFFHVFANYRHTFENLKIETAMSKNIIKDKRTRGGARPGAGRKKGGHNRIPANSLIAKEKLIEQIRQKWEPIVQTMIDVGLGDYYYEKNTTGETIKVYKAAPDVKALTTLIEFVVGKPKQEIEQSGTMNVESQSIKQLTQTMRTILNSKGIMSHE